MKKINRCDIFVFITLLMCACAHKSGHGERVMISSNYKNEGVQKENGRLDNYAKTIKRKGGKMEGPEIFRNTLLLFLWYSHLMEEILIKDLVFS